MIIYDVFYGSHRDCIRDSIEHGGSGCYVPDEGVVYHGNSEVMIYLVPFFLVPAVGFWLIGNAVRRYKII